MSNAIKMMAAQASLQKLVSQGHFSICALDTIAEMLGVKPEREAYQILRTLHCVDYNQMSKELLAELPDLIARVIQSPSFEASRINIVSADTSLKIIRGDR